MTLAGRIEKITAAAGELALWTVPLLVTVQAGSVLLRHSFGVNLIFVQDAILYLYALLFLLGMAATMMRNGHVRIDTISRRFSPKTQIWVDLIGTALFILPFSMSLFVFSLPYVAASVSILEGARDPTGLQAVFVLKTGLLVFAGLVFLQALAIFARSITALFGGVPPE